MHKTFFIVHAKGAHWTDAVCSWPSRALAVHYVLACQPFSRLQMAVTAVCFEEAYPGKWFNTQVTPVELRMEAPHG